MYNQILEDILPNALVWGVNYELFWSLSPKELAPFTKAFQLKQIQDDQFAWLQGRYIQTAVVSALNSKVKYPKSPYWTANNPILDASEKAKIIKQKFWTHAQLLNTQIRRNINNE